MYFQRKKISLAVGSLFIVGTAFTSASYAQEQGSTERVTITGSSISRIAAEGALPVQTVTRDDIEKSGAKNVTDLIQGLTSMQAFTTAGQSVGGGGAGLSAASIHGIGETRTLVLLNGRRVANWAGQTLTGYGAALDLNSLPISAIERVEVLTDGASALYGADAVAGVVNFILKTNQQAAEFSYSEEIPKGGSGKQINWSLTKGFGDLNKDGYNFMFAFSHDKKQEMASTERSYTKTGMIPFQDKGRNLIFFNGSPSAIPGNWEMWDDNGTRDWSGNNHLQSTGSCAARNFNAALGDGFCYFDYTSTVFIQPEQERDNLLLSFVKKLDGNHKLSADLTWSDFTLTSKIAPAPIPVNITPGSALYNKYGPGGSSDLYALGTGATDWNAYAGYGASSGPPQYGDTLYAYWRGYDASNRTTSYNTKALNLAVALEGSIGKWDYGTSFTHSTNTWTETLVNGWLSVQRRNAAVAAGDFDPFVGIGQQTAAGLAAINSMKWKGKYRETTSSLDVLEWHGSREAFATGAGMAMLGAGIDYKRENVNFKPSAMSQGRGGPTGDDMIAGDAAEDVPFDVSRKSWGAFLELNVPITKQLELTGAIRHDDYEDFGGTDNYKLAMRFQPSKTLLFRGAVGTGFRAPSVPQVSVPNQHYGVTSNRYSCATLAPALAHVQATIDPATGCQSGNRQRDQIAGGNPDLQPETSNQWTVGFRVDPIDNLSIGADYWNVHVKDRIGQLSEATIMGDVTNYLKNFSVYNGDLGPQIAIYAPNENLGEEKFAGIDVDGRWTVRTGLGKLVTSLKWTHMLKHDYQRLKNGAWYSDLGKYNDNSVTLKDIARLSFSLVTGDWVNTLTFNHKSGYRDLLVTAGDESVLDYTNGVVGAPVDVTRHVDAFNTFDWQTQYHYKKLTTVTLGVLNITNEKAPFTLAGDAGHQVGFDARYANALGRVLYLNAKVSF